MLIELRDLTFEIEGVLALDGLSARLEGAAIGLLGANGSGKTSLLRVLAGLARPSRGEVLVDGRSITMGRHPWISYLPQETAFFPFQQHPAQTLSLSMAFRGVVDPEAPSRVLEALGLQDDDRSAAGFSGGMKQKLRIAPALIHAPQVLLLDEPTTGLDARERLRVLRLLERLRDRVGITFSTHDPADAAAVCDLVIILHAGRLVTSGSPEALRRFAAGLVYEMTVPSGAIPARSGGEVIAAERVGEAFRIRVLGVPPSPDLAVEPTLEDACLLLTGHGPMGQRSLS
jgi:ABC-2 type transport system ATP-binding protein